jgi:putative DNA primase/helicase
VDIIVCADDDASTRGNPGITKAVEAALAVNGKVARPDFGDARPERATDFNDVAVHCGAEAVKRAVDAATIPVTNEPQPAQTNVANGAMREPWNDPLPLPNTLPLVQPFDYDLLPDALSPWIKDIAERVQCPPDFPAVGAMIALAAVVGRKIGIRPKRHDDWTEVPNLWGAVVGRPGVMKSPALRESMRPLARLDANALKEFSEAFTEWKQRQELHKLTREAAKATIVRAMKASKPVALDALPADFAEGEPNARRYVVNDCSVEALGVILQGNPNGTLAYRDELIGLLKSLDKEGNEGARGFFLSAWSGTDSYTFDRIGRGLNMRIDACCLSLLGSIQPAIIGNYLREAVATGGGDGLLSRFQLLVWPDVAGEWRDIDRWPDNGARKIANDTFDRLDSLDPIAIGAEADDAGGIPYLRFGAEAQDIFSEWRAGFERRLRSGTEHDAFESHLSKYRKLVPSLALLIHLADNQSGPIGTAPLLKALAWSEYLESHAKRAYASVAQAEAESARALLQRIKKGEVTNPFIVRDVYRKGWTHLAESDQVRKAVKLLRDHDYLRGESSDTDGRPKTEIWINPKVMA